MLPSHFADCEDANRKIEFVTFDCFLLQNGQWLTLNNLKQSGIDRASECGRYPCRSLFAAMDGDDGDKVCVLGMDDVDDVVYRHIDDSFV